MHSCSHPPLLVVHSSTSEWRKIVHEIKPQNKLKVALVVSIIFCYKILHLSLDLIWLYYSLTYQIIFFNWLYILWVYVQWILIQMEFTPLQRGRWYPVLHWHLSWPTHGLLFGQTVLSKHNAGIKKNRNKYTNNEINQFASSFCMTFLFHRSVWSSTEVYIKVMRRNACIIYKKEPMILIYVRMHIYNINGKYHYVTFTE